MSKPVLAVLHSGDRPPRMSVIEDAAEVRYATTETLGDAVDGADALFLWDFFSTAVKDVWNMCGSLKWIHVAAAGVDKLLFDELSASEVVVTNSRGIFDRPIAEFVLGSILALAKDSRRSIEFSGRHEWRHRETDRVDGTRALVVGTGSIGRAIARLLRAVDIEVAGAGRTAREGDNDFGTVYASDDLVSVVGDYDYLVLVAPLTAQTHGLVNASVLAATKRGVRVVNVGRGELLDTDALIEGLRSGHIDGAALDVFDIEPLPPEHPLWDSGNVLLTPHMSGDFRGWHDKLIDLFQQNWDLYASGAELENVVDKKLGFVPS